MTDTSKERCEAAVQELDAVIAKHETAFGVNTRTSKAGRDAAALIIALQERVAEVERELNDTLERLNVCNAYCREANNTLNKRVHAELDIVRKTEKAFAEMAKKWAANPAAWEHETENRYFRQIRYASERVAEARLISAEAALAEALEVVKAVAQRANESGVEPTAERETIYAMHKLAYALIAKHGASNDK